MGGCFRSNEGSGGGCGLILLRGAAQGPDTLAWPCSPLLFLAGLQVRPGSPAAAIRGAQAIQGSGVLWASRCP